MIASASPAATWVSSSTSRDLAALCQGCGLVTAIVNDWGALVSVPPLAVPPVSLRTMVIVAVPLVFGLGVKVSFPVGSIEGGAENSDGLLLFCTWNVADCPASSGGPMEMAVAQLAIDCGPLSSVMFWPAPLVKLGAAFTSRSVIISRPCMPSSAEK